MASTVVVSESVFGKGEEVFTASTRFRCVRAPDDEAGLVRAIRESGADHAVLGHRRYEGALYTAFAPGRVLARFGVGHDGIDKAKATAAGLLCTNTPGTLDDSVAELAMLLIGAAARHLTALTDGMRRGDWAPLLGTELRRRTLAVIGCGRIGSALARIAGLGYGMHVVGYTRSPSAAPPAPGYTLFTADFATAVAAADFVSLHIAATPENAHFIGRERLSMIGERAWLINTARGAVVDERALHQALSQGRLAGAALDVFDREPYEPIDAAHDLRVLPNVIMTPHVGSHTPEANRRMAEAALRNIELAEEGRFDAMALLNPEVLRRGNVP
jgi:phosphoglycerate dehydrogenase-like enzyme